MACLACFVPGDDGKVEPVSKRILLVDDEPLIVKGLKYALEQEGYSVDSALDGEEALNKFSRDSIDLILLDVMLPKMDGFEVCQRIREVSEVPILMLTAKGDEMDRILGLEYGADDYIAKPFNVLEVKARIRAIFRRTQSVYPRIEHEQHTIKVMDLEITPARHYITLRGKELRLTSREYELLLLFVNNRGKVFSRKQLLELLWEPNFDGDERTVDVHIRRLREKIEKRTSEPEYILTKWGVGYYFTERD